MSWIVGCVLPGIAIGSLVPANALLPWLPLIVIAYALMATLWDIYQAAPRRLALRGTLLRNWREDERRTHFRKVFVAACLATGIAPPFTWLTFGLWCTARVVLTGALALCAMLLGRSPLRGVVAGLLAYLLAGVMVLAEDRRERGPGTPFPVPPNRPLTVAARILFWPLVKARRARVARAVARPREGEDESL